MMMITPTLLRLMEICERRVWLDHYGEESRRDAPMVIQRLIDGEQHEAAVHAATAPFLESIPVEDWADGVRVTQRWIEQGAYLINGACLEASLSLNGQTVIVRGRVDRIMRVSGRRTPIYAPIEIKSYTRLAPPDLLQMDFYIWLLTQTQGIEPSGEFWLGRDFEDRPLRRIRHDYRESRLMTALEKMTHLLNPQLEPPVVLRSHCKECPWYSACKTLATERLDVSLLSGLRQDTRKQFQAMGITSLHQIAAMQPDDLRKFKGIKSTATAVHAHARAWVNRQPVWFQPLAAICHKGGWMFDIETDPYSGIVWCIGWTDDQGSSDIALVAPQVSQPQRYVLHDHHSITLVPDSDSAWEVFAQGIASNQKPVFHWTGFDAGVMNKTAPEHVKAALAHRLVDLHHLVNQSVRFPVKGTSIKVLSGYLDFKYSVYEAWDAALNDYNLWLSRADEAALSRACSYQRDDVLSMVVVWRWLVDHSVDENHDTT